LGTADTAAPENIAYPLGKGTASEKTNGPARRKRLRIKLEALGGGMVNEGGKFGVLTRKGTPKARQDEGGDRVHFHIHAWAAGKQSAPERARPGGRGFIPKSSVQDMDRVGAKAGGVRARDETGTKKREIGRGGMRCAGAPIIIWATGEGKWSKRTRAGRTKLQRGSNSGDLKRKNAKTI